MHLGLGELINATIAGVTERPEETEEPLSLRHRVDAAVTCLLANILTRGASGMAARVRQTSPVLSEREAEIVVAASAAAARIVPGWHHTLEGLRQPPTDAAALALFANRMTCAAIGPRWTAATIYDAWSAICRTGGRRHAA